MRQGRRRYIYCGATGLKITDGWIESITVLGFNKTAIFISAFGEGNFLKDRRIESKSGEKEFYFLEVEEN